MKSYTRGRMARKPQRYYALWIGDTARWATLITTTPSLIYARRRLRRWTRATGTPGYITRERGPLVPLGAR